MLIFEVSVPDIPSSPYKGLKRKIYRLSALTILFCQLGVDFWRNCGVGFPKGGGLCARLSRASWENARTMGAFSNR